MTYIKVWWKNLGLHLLSLVFLVACSQQSAPQLPHALGTVSLLPEASWPGAIATNPNTNYVYVIGDSGQASVFYKDQLVATLQVGEQIRPNLAVDPQNGWVYVLNEGDHSVTLIKNTDVISTMMVVGRRPTDVTIEPNTGWAYIVTGTSSEIRDDMVEGNVTVFSGDEIIGAIPLGRTLAKFVVANPNGYIYVGAIGGDVVVIKELQEIVRFKTGLSVIDMDVNPHNGDVYVLAPSIEGQDIHRFRQGQLMDGLKVEGEGGSVYRMKVHPLTGDVYVVDEGREEVVVVHPAESLEGALVVTDRIPVGRGPGEIAIDPLTGNVYVVNTFANSVTVIHDKQVIATLPVGRYPNGIGINPANGWVYVSNTNEHSVTILGYE